MKNYRESSAVNQSLLKAILKGMGSVKKLGLYYEEQEHLLLGNAVDAILTQSKEAFDSAFYIDTLTTKPSAMVMSITKAVYDATQTNLPMNDESVKDLILIQCNMQDYCTKMKDAVRVKRIIEQGSAYFDHLYRAEGRSILSMEQYGLVNTICNSLTTNESTGVYLSSRGNVEVLGQVAIYFSHMQEECKALLDIIHIDHFQKKIFPIDIKTMGESTKAFNRQAKRFRYDIQAAFYTLAILKWREDNYPAYTVEPFRFIVESTTSPGICPLVYVCTKLDIEAGLYGFHPITGYTEANIPIHGAEVQGIEQAMNLYKWHRDNDEWETEKHIIEKNRHLYLNLWNIPKI